MIAELTGEELSKMKAFLERFDRKLFDELLGKYSLATIGEEGEKTIIVSGRETAELAKRLSPETFGLPFGEFRFGDFYLGLEGLYLIGGMSDRKKVILDEKGVQFFLYGRDVKGKHINIYDEDLKTGDLTLVTTPYGEVIGLATVAGKLEKLGTVIHKLLDRGWYLREGG
ncbi:MAG: hypothetical protein CVT48_04115 [Thermoplasmata archaeon HGW-Thermoplasmata-1]|nr:MAG: hypothetical protein CVT48_04115 [Thermoplasmata archaeon HGW-Thermoplasmata-1]